MKHWLKGLGALALGGLLLAQTAQAETRELNLYSAQQEHLIRPILEDFTKDTGITVNVTTLEGPALHSRLKLEKRDTPADVVLTADVGNLHQLRLDMLLQPVFSETLNKNIPSHLRDSGGYWYGFTTRARVVFYAKDRVKPDAVKTYADLADPKWKGKLLVRPAMHVYNQSLLASIIAHEGEDAAIEWAKGIQANLARAPEGGDRDQLRAVAAGAGDLALSNTYYYLLLRHSEDPNDRALAEKLGVIFPEQSGRGAHINIRGGGVVIYSKRRDEAVQLLEYLSGEKAQRFFAEQNFEYPVNPKVPVPEALAVLGNAMFDLTPLTKIAELTPKAAVITDRAEWR